MPGVQINFSKFNSPALIFSINSSLQTISAPATLASSAATALSGDILQTCKALMPQFASTVAMI